MADSGVKTRPTMGVLYSGIADTHFQALDTFELLYHSRVLSSLRDQLFGSPSMGTEG